MVFDDNIFCLKSKIQNNYSHNKLIKFIFNFLLVLIEFIKKKLDGI